jgi:dolichyl-phosphate-mannose--protein O-mannosyl transferase
MSGASKISKQSKNREAPAAGGRQYDQLSMTSSQQQKTEVYSEIDEDDEWAAIQKFNTLLHYEEQKQAILRDKERKRLIREELEKQLYEKQGRKYREVEENKMYEKL